MPYTHLADTERDRLQIFLDKGHKIQDIASQLSRHRSTIYRELARNRSGNCYISGKAHAQAHDRRQKACIRTKMDNAVLMEKVRNRFERDHSPEQIAGRLKLEYPANSKFHVSHETIYRYVYECIRNGDTALRHHLRHSHIHRRKRLSCKDKRGIIPGRTLIDSRPAIVDKKSRRGDWEGDTIEGAKKRGYIATFVDRKSKLLTASVIRHKSAQELLRGACRAFRKIPRALRKTMTIDNGKEFASHFQLGALLGVRVFFAHPYHSWERGLNEHTNGLLRQYFPKNMPLDKVKQNKLEQIVRKINDRPRKALGFRTPREVFFNLPVALQN